MYKSLTDSTRKLNVPAPATTGGAEKTDTRLGDRRNSIDWKGEAWYRVMGNAGTRIPEYPFSSVQSGEGGYCKTGCPGYLPKGSHPQTPGQIVYNVKVCYNCHNDMCNYSKPGIDRHVVKIRHCGDFFVYYLTESKYLGVRYCTE